MSAGTDDTRGVSGGRGAGAAQPQVSSGCGGAGCDGRSASAPASDAAAARTTSAVRRRARSGFRSDDGSATMAVKPRRRRAPWARRPSTGDHTSPMPVSASSTWKIRRARPPSPAWKIRRTRPPISHVERPPRTPPISHVERPPRMPPHLPRGTSAAYAAPSPTWNIRRARRPSPTWNVRRVCRPISHVEDPPRTPPHLPRGRSRRRTAAFRTRARAGNSSCRCARRRTTRCPSSSGRACDRARSRAGC